jgi:hypothetical protein
MTQQLVTLALINNYLENNTEIDAGFAPSFFNESFEHKKYTHFKKLKEYHLFRSYAAIAVNEFKLILAVDNTLENGNIKAWVIKHLSFYETNLSSFLLDYLDSGNDKDNNLHLTSLNIYVEKTPFLTIIQFCELQWLLYFEEYHLDKENRTLPNTQDYYYSPPDPNRLSDLDKVKEILGML